MGRREDLEKFDPDWNYESDTQIDRLLLDEHWENQSNTFMRYAILAAQATKEYQEYWEAVKTIRSELIKEFREDYPKAKNDEVEAHYRTHEDYKSAKQEMIEAEFIKNILDGAVMAMHQKKAGLEHMVKLHGQAYFCTPATEGARQDKHRHQQKQVRGDIRKRMNPDSRRRSGRKR